jgi:Flp pilus assembly protein TadD
MNKGAIDRAVWLLHQAQLADPANPLVAHDLDRARKIQATVRRR